MLGVLCDVIMPEGSTKKYIRTVFGVVVSLAVVRYAMVTAQNLGKAQENFEVQTNFVQSVRKRQTDEERRMLTEVCRLRGINAEVEIDKEKQRVIFTAEEQPTSRQRQEIAAAVGGLLGKQYTTEFVEKEVLPHNGQVEGICKQT